MITVEGLTSLVYPNIRANKDILAYETKRAHDELSTEVAVFGLDPTLFEAAFLDAVHVHKALSKQRHRLRAFRWA